MQVKQAMKNILSGWHYSNMKYDFLTLTSEENQALYERGFVVKSWLRWWIFFLYLFPRIAIVAIITMVFIFFQGGIVLPWIWLVCIIWVIWKLIAFLSIHTLFHTPYGILLRWKIVSYEDIIAYTKSFDFGLSLPNKEELDMGFGIFAGIIYVGFYLLLEIKKEDWIPYLFGLTIFGFILFFGRKNFIIHNPFQSTFQWLVRLGLSIEKSLHILETSSENIVIQFTTSSKKEDFSQFESNFNHLAKEFTRIIHQLEKLEVIEKHMQQGDVIDTSKYISYLKKETSRPIRKIYQFLENQKSALMNQDAILNIEQFSHNPLTQNIDLAKKRITVLQTSIEISLKKLDEFLLSIS